jgi:uncharacterized protein (TIGR02284 family)
MSHPNSPRVSTDSAAATALSAAGNDHDTSTATSGSAAADTANAGGTTDSNSGGVAGMFSQAQRWLQGQNVTDSLSKVSEPLQRLGTQTGNRWRQMSTTQKVLGGTALAAGAFFLLRRTGGGSKRRNNTGDTLHELLLFVNDRIEGYERAVSESKDQSLRSYYQQLVSQSQQFARTLNGYLRVQDSSEETGTTIKGKFYRAWMEAKAAVTGYSEEAILGSNIYGEEWALKAYQEALADSSLTGSLRREVQRQYDQSNQTYRKLQQLQRQREQH